MAVTGALIALATALSFVKVYQLPYGGSITLFSMVPIMVIGYKYSWKWGLLSGFISGILQAILGATTSQAFAGVEGFNIVLMTVLDFLIAFAVLGLAGIFRKVVKNDIAAISLGALFTGFLRLVAHFASGFLLWGSYAESFFQETVNNGFGDKILTNFSGTGLALVYSAVYNGSYMIPEIIISVIGVAALMGIKPVRKLITQKD